MKDRYRVVVFEPNLRRGTPADVYEEVRQLWADYELGNDWYYHPWYVDERYPKLTAYIEGMFDEAGTERVLIHWWW